MHLNCPTSFKNVKVKIWCQVWDPHSKLQGGAEGCRSQQLAPKLGEQLTLTVKYLFYGGPNQMHNKSNKNQINEWYETNK